MNGVHYSHGENPTLEIATLPVLLMNYNGCREQMWNMVRVRRVSSRFFRKTQIAVCV